MSFDSSSSDDLLSGDDVLAVLGAMPVPHDIMIERLTASGFDGVDVDEVRFAIRDDGRVADLEAGLVSIPALFDGVRWTVEVYEPSNDDFGGGDDEVDSDDHLSDFERGEWLVVENGAVPLSWWLVMNHPTAVRPDGGQLGMIETEGVWRVDREIDVFCADDHWLDHALPASFGRIGSPVFVEVTAVDGAIRVAPLDAVPNPTQRQVAAVKTAFEQVANTESMVSHIVDDTVDLEFADTSSVIEAAVVHDRPAFVDDPAPLHDALLTAAGLDGHGRLVGRPGTDWSMLDVWRRRKQLVSMFGFSEKQADQLQVLGGAAAALVHGDAEAFGPPEKRRSAADVLATIFDTDVEVGQSFVEQWIDSGQGPDGLLRFADAIIAILGEATPGVGWLRATALDLLGRSVEAADELAKHTSSEHESVLVAAAGFAADRSDGVEAHRLLRRAGALDHLAEHDGRFVHDTADLLLLEEILPFASRPKAAAKRNDPCPCGSGKKYKACHLGSEMYPLADRAGWLYQKAARFTAQHAGLDIEDVAEIMAAEVGLGALRSLRTSEFVADVVRHEGGVFERFLEARSMFLPNDEAELARAWAAVDRSVFVVNATQRRSMTLQNVQTDVIVDVLEVAAPTVPDVGVVLVGRPLPVGDTHRAFSGFFEIRPESIDELLDAFERGPTEELARVMGAAMATAAGWSRSVREGDGPG